LALAVPLSRFTSRVGGGSAFFVRHHLTAMTKQTRLIAVARIFLAIVACSVWVWHAHQPGHTEATTVQHVSEPHPVGDSYGPATMQLPVGDRNVRDAVAIPTNSVSTLKTNGR
jgi:hypothetical protein